MTDDDSGGLPPLNGGIFPRRLSSLRNRAPVTQTAMKIMFCGLLCKICICSFMPSNPYTAELGLNNKLFDTPG